MVVTPPPVVVAVVVVFPSVIVVVVFSPGVNSTGTHSGCLGAGFSSDLNPSTRWISIALRIALLFL